MTEKSHFVYGPQGCGKTRNAARIAKHFGLSRILDDWDGRQTPPKFDTLILTNLQPDTAYLDMFGPRRCHAYNSLPASVRG